VQNDVEAAKQWGQRVNGLTTQLVRLHREKAAQSTLRSPGKSTTEPMGAGNGHGT